MDYLSENCYLSTLKDNNEMDLFHCGDADLDDFFHNDSIAYINQLLGKNVLVPIEHSSIQCGGSIYREQCKH